MAKKVGKKRGPKTKYLKIKGNWQGAVNKALRREKPQNDWPKGEKKG